MALDKIIDSAKLDGALSATADAIRNKTGATDSIPWDSSTGFKTAVESMEVGGSSEWGTVMPATDVAFTDGGEYISFETVYPLTTGKRYKVKWGDTEYELTAVDTVFDGMPCVAIGNVGALAGNPSAEPFVIGYIPAANGFGIFRLDGSDEAVNVTIYVSTIPVPVILPLEITENGTYAAPDGADGYSPVTVNVASSGGGGSVEGAHTVTFMNEDGTVTYGTKPVMNGDTCGDPIALGVFATPTKESTAQYNYSFYGWATTPNGAADSNALVNITGDKTVYANFASAVRYYTVNYYDDDTLLHTEQLAYGTTPSYEPEKTGYIFSGWSPSLATVTGNADYYAQWTETVVVLYSGSCGDNAAYTLDNRGVLTISGSGATKDYEGYSPSFPPWYDYRANIKTVVVEQGITSLGKYSFNNCYNLASVTLPDGLIKIGRFVFGNTSKLSNIELPSSTTTFESLAFRWATGLTELIIPSGTTVIPEMFCDGCTKLQNVVIPDTVTTIHQNMLSSCTNLTHVTVPANVTLLGRYFIDKSGVTSVVFEEPEGWWYSTYHTDTSGTTISSSTLSDPTSATELLKGTCRDKYLHRS